MGNLVERVRGREGSIKWESLVRDIIIESLYKTLSVHDNLGKDGEKLVQKNQFGETALKVDIECEEAVINLLKSIGFPAQVISEEHGVVNVGNPRYLAILDGLDGSNVYKRRREQEARYGTMFGIFHTTNPTYNDYLACGIIEHPTRRLFFAIRNAGAYVVERGKTIPIHTSGRTQLGPDTNVYVDTNFEINRYTFSDRLQAFRPKCMGSSAVHYADVAFGKADLALECTRKNNLEIAIGTA
jgi:fructose-1,6-bisphosphatase/inositol monophosphatase family enzyme